MSRFNPAPRRTGERGMAIMTALWMTLIGVMLVTSIAAMIQGGAMYSFSASAVAKARIAAESGINRAIADLIADRPQGGTDTSGVMLTEICNTPFINLVDDASFEVFDTAVWSRSASVTNGGTARTGIQAVQMENPTLAYTGRWAHNALDSITVVPGARYKLGAWRHIEVTLAGLPVGVSIQLRVVWANAASQSLGSAQFSDTWYVTASPVPYVNMESGPFIAPAGAVKAHIVVEARDTTISTIIRAIIDDVYLQPTTDAAYEYIEIQNFTANPVDLVASQYWISVDTPSNIAAGNRRYISPLFGGSSTLGVGDLGVIVGINADTPYISSYLNASSSINWFGLGAAVGTPIDTQLGKAGTRAMIDTGDVVVVGFGGAGGPPATPPYWFGVPLPATGSVSSETSWRKITLNIRDKHTSPFDTFAATNWRRDVPNPGVGLAARTGYDGAPHRVLGVPVSDTWYQQNFSDYISLDTTTGPVDLYYRIRIFDEGSKINLNVIKSASQWESGVFINLLQQVPNPPFKAVTAYNANNAKRLADALINTWSVAGGVAKLLTFESANLLYATGGDAFSAGVRRGMSFDSAYIPFVTVYGYNEPNVFPINVNMAESPVLRAALIYACGDSPSYDTPLASALADKMVNYLTGGDNNPANDTGFRSLSAMPLATGYGITAADTGALQWAINNGQLQNVLAVSSTNYFMVYSTGFVFKKGADVNTDTPLASMRIVSIVRRSASTNKADIVFWREIFEIANPENRALTFPIGSNRYPWYKWDPLQ